MPQKTEVIRNKPEYTRRKKNRRGASRKEMAEDAAQPHKRMKGEIKFKDPEYYERKAAHDQWEKEREHEKRSEASKKAAETKKKNEERRRREAEFLRKVPKMEKMIARLRQQQSQASSVKSKKKLQKKMDKIVKKIEHMKLKFEDAQRIHSYRPKKFRDRDEKSTAKKQVSDWRWAQNPGRYDYPGVDTKDTKYNPFTYQEDRRQDLFEFDSKQYKKAKSLLTNRLSKKKLKEMDASQLSSIKNITSGEASVMVQKARILGDNIKEETDPVRKKKMQELHRKMQDTGLALTKKLHRIDEAYEKKTSGKHFAFHPFGYKKTSDPNKNVKNIQASLKKMEADYARTIKQAERLADKFPSNSKAFVQQYRKDLYRRKQELGELIILGEVQPAVRREYGFYSRKKQELKDEIAFLEKIRKKENEKAKMEKWEKKAQKNLEKQKKRDDRYSKKAMGMRTRLAEIERAIASNEKQAEQLRKEGSRTRLGRIERALETHKKRKAKLEEKIRKG